MFGRVCLCVCVRVFGHFNEFEVAELFDIFYMLCFLFEFIRTSPIIFLYRIEI